MNFENRRRLLSKSFVVLSKHMVDCYGEVDDMPLFIDVYSVIIDAYNQSRSEEKAVVIGCYVAEQLSGSPIDANEIDPKIGVYLKRLNGFPAQTFEDWKHGVESDAVTEWCCDQLSVIAPLLAIQSPDQMNRRS